MVSIVGRRIAYLAKRGEANEAASTVNLNSTSHNKNLLHISKEDINYARYYDHINIKDVSINNECSMDTNVSNKVVPEEDTISNKSCCNLSDTDQIPMSASTSLNNTPNPLDQLEWTPKPKNINTKLFIAKNIVNTPIESILTKGLLKAQVDKVSLLVLLVYIERLLEFDRSFLNTRSVHLITIITLMCADKLTSDAYVVSIQSCFLNVFIN